MMPGTATGWDGAGSVDYAAYCRRHDLYRLTSAALVAAVAQHCDGDGRLIDLASGTGVTAVEVLRRFGGPDRLTCIDHSENLLDIARSDPALKGVAFLKGRGEALCDLVTPGVSLIVCNSAFWLMTMPAVLRAARAVLRRNGLFAFSMPGYLLRLGVGEGAMGSMPAPMAAFVAAAGVPPAAASWLRQQDYGLSEAALAAMVTRAGLRILDRQTYGHWESLDATIDALRLPALLPRYAPGMELGESLRLLQQVSDTFDRDSVSMVTWYNYVLTSPTLHEGL